MNYSLWVFGLFIVMVLSVCAAKDVAKARTMVQDMLLRFYELSGFVVLGLGLVFMWVTS